MTKAKNSKIPAVVATSTMASIMLIGGIATATTSTASQYPAASEPTAMIRYLNNDVDCSTSSAAIKSYAQIAPPVNALEAATELFGAMRNSTEEEVALFEAMLESKSTSIGVNVFSL